MAMTMEKRPDGTSMEGMIWNANYTLDACLDPKTKGIPRNLFKRAHGIALISMVEFGLIFSGNTGTGIIMAKNKDDGKWSPPSAVGIGGIGAGAVFGFSEKDLIIFIMDERTMSAYAGGIQCRLGAQGNLTFGSGRDAEMALDASNKGVGGTVSVALSQGSFFGATIEGAILKPKSKVNDYFYAKSASPHQILLERDSVEVPDGTLIPDLHKKLELLAEGQTHVPTDEEKKKVEAAKQEAFKAAETAKTRHDDIEFVDTKKEAEKASTAAT